MADVTGESDRFIFEGVLLLLPESERSRSDRKFEYRATLIHKGTGQVVDEWDSRQNAIPSQYGLTRKDARDALVEIKEDVENGNADGWFRVRY